MPTNEYNRGFDAGERDRHKGNLRADNDEESSDYQQGYLDGYNKDNTGDEKD